MESSEERKLLEAKRINVMSQFNTGKQEGTVKNKGVFFGGLILYRVLAPSKSCSVVVNSNFF